jgi:hypothetical protein
MFFTAMKIYIYVEIFARSVLCIFPNKGDSVFTASTYSDLLFPPSVLFPHRLKKRKLSFERKHIQSFAVV